MQSSPSLLNSQRIPITKNSGNQRKYQSKQNKNTSKQQQQRYNNKLTDATNTKNTKWKSTLKSQSDNKPNGHTVNWSGLDKSTLGEDDYQEISFEHFVNNIEQEDRMQSSKNNATVDVKNKYNQRKQALNQNMIYQSLQIKKLKLANKILQQKHSSLLQKYTKMQQQCKKLLQDKTHQQKQLKNQKQEIKNIKKANESQHKHELKILKQQLQKQNTKIQTDLKDSHKNSTQKLLQQICNKQKISLLKHRQQIDSYKLEIQAMTAKLEQLQRKQRIGNKQMQKYAQIIEDRNQYYDGVVDGKDKQLEIVRAQINQVTARYQAHVDNIQYEQQQQASKYHLMINSLTEQNQRIQQVMASYEHNLHQITKIIQTANQQVLQAISSKIKTTRYEYPDYKTRNQRIINNNGNANNSQIWIELRQLVMGVILQRKQLILSKDAISKLYEQTYKHQFTDLQKKMGLLMDENTFFKAQIQKNIGQCSSLNIQRSHRSSRSQQQTRRSRSRSPQLDRPGLMSNNTLLQYNNSIDGQKSHFMTQLSNLQKQRKYHSSSTSLQDKIHEQSLASLSYLQNNKESAIITNNNSNIHNNLNIRDSSNTLNTLNTKYFADHYNNSVCNNNNSNDSIIKRRRARSIDRIQQSACMIQNYSGIAKQAELMSNNHNNKSNRVNIRDEVAQAKLVMQGTIVDSFGGRPKRGRSMPSLKRQAISWRKPSSRILDETY